VRPHGHGQSGQGDAHAAAVRRSARALSAAPPRGCWDRGAILMGAAGQIADCGGRGQVLRVRAGGTKCNWGTPVPDPEVVVSTAELDRITEHNEGDLTAILEAGVPLTAAQEKFAEAGQMLALDPPLGEGNAATIGGVVATGDSGPLR